MAASVTTSDRTATSIHDAARQNASRGVSDLELAARLRSWFSVEFHLFDGESGELVRSAPDQRGIDCSLIGPLCRAVAERGSAECLDDDEPLFTLAIPSIDAAGRSRVAVGIFVTGSPASTEQWMRLVGKLGFSPDEAERWIVRQPRFAPHALMAMGQMAAERLAADHRIVVMEGEVREVSAQLSRTYEEISLLHQLARNLKLSSNAGELARMALEWLADVMPAESLAISLTAPNRLATQGGEEPGEPLWLCYGQCPLNADEFSQLTARIGAGAAREPLIVNSAATSDVAWPWPSVRQLILVPLAEGEHCFGWLAAFNHERRAEFGTVEASLLSSVGAILGIHSGNAELYQQQREFFAGMVRALTSAIDAKDPYTCGHSDRVARVAVRLAEELGLDRKQIDTIYLSGPAARRRQDRHRRRGAAQARQTHRSRIRAHQDARRNRLPHPGRHQAARRRAAGRAAPSRAMGRQRISARPGRREHSRYWRGSLPWPTRSTP